MECKQVGYFIHVIFILIIYKIRISSSSCKCSGSTIDCSRLKLTRMTWNNSEECNKTLSTEKVVLDFSHNQISLTGERIWPLENVETIDLSYNHINQLLGFGQSTLHNDLLNLVLSHNSIKSIKENDIQSLSSLKILDLSYNRILFIEEGTFSFLFRLECLDLSWNYLTTFAMHCLDSIGFLYFNNNRLHTFTLEGTCNFIELDLTFNNFSTFPETDDGWKGEIYFGGNPEVCKNLEEREDVYTNIRCEILVKFTVPPRVFLSYDNVTLTNASYHKEHGYKTYFGGNNPYVAEREAINVTCLAEEAKPHANITWMINGRVVDNVPPQETQRNSQENRTFNSISTLQFTPTGEEVNITCNVSLNGTDIQTSANAKFLTYVLPRIFFLLNGKRIDSTVVYVGQGETVNITCYAEGSRPLANLSWEENYDILESSLQERLNVNNATFDTLLTLITSPESDVERITCRSSIAGINKFNKVDLKIQTYVLREPSITFNGRSLDVLPVDKSDNVTLICSVVDSRPVPTLTWKINGELPQDGTSEVFSSDGSSNLVLQPTEKDIAECVSYLPGPNITRVAKVSFDFREDTASFNYILNVIVPCIGATVTIFLVLCVYSASRRIKGSGPADFSASLQLALRSRPVNGVSNISRDLPSIRRSMVIPTDDDNIEINCEEDKTSAVTNVELGVHLPGEGTFQYWTACASVKNENSKKIIAKCVSESVQMKEHMNFRTLAENLKTLTTHRNIIEIIGVSVTSVPYYIYMEYLEYGTLRDFLMRNYQQSSDSQTNMAQTLDERAIHLTGFALDVADGLIFLTDRDYRHPALCARKILLTKTGTCKLYDFWPKALSTERIHQILQKSHPPVAWLSPETIFLRHYFEKSDVWNFGVVLWEIYSLGEIPYSGLTCEEIEQEIRKMHYLDQPLTCPGGIFSMMLASWDTTVDDRPDLSEWKQKLVCLLQSARQELDDKNSTKGSGDQSYFTLENNVCDYEDDYIEQ